ncbi:dihydrodipicolinate synthase family protein, partial [Acinetobacter pittii]
MKNNFSGTYTTIITPFDKDNNICEKTLKKVIDFQISN